jgi:hypothetical protein
MTARGKLPTLLQHPTASRRHGVSAATAWFALATMWSVRPAGADAPTQDCIAAHARGQELRLGGHLLAAQASYLTCVVPRCPDVVRSDCARLLGEVAAAIPRLVVVLKPSNGRENPPIRITLDGRTEGIALDGKAIGMDPGPHQLDASYASGATQHQVFTLREGEQERRVEVDYAPQNRERSLDQRWSNVHPAVYALGVVGVAALGAFTYFGLSGKSKERELEKCAPTCSDSDVHVMRTRYLAADLSLGASVVTLGTAAYFFFALGTRGQPTTAGGASLQSPAQWIGSPKPEPHFALTWRGHF